MILGMTLPQLGELADPAAVRLVAEAAEASGLDSLWVLDRILSPIDPRSPYPASADGILPDNQSAVLDPIGVLTLAAALTERIRLGTNVLVLPWYPPVLLARSLATLDLVSNGRLVAGLGLGWSIDEYEAVGAPMRALGRRAEEILDVLHTAWNDDVSSAHTSRERLAPSTIGAKPFRIGGPEILLAAYTPAGLERIARRADGWTPAGVPLSTIPEMWTFVRSQAEKAGRDPSSLRVVVRANVHLTDRLSGARPDFCGTIDQVAADVARAREIGIDELFVDLHESTSSAAAMLELTQQIYALADVREAS